MYIKVTNLESGQSKICDHKKLVKKINGERKSL